jgi:hypothetical protein
LKFVDLAIVQIAPPHAGKVIRSLISKGVITQNEKVKRYRVNDEYFISNHSNALNNSSQKLRVLIGKHLIKSNYQKGKTNLTKLVDKVIPNEKHLRYQNGNSGTHGLVSIKDILKQKNKK